MTEVKKRRDDETLKWQIEKIHQTYAIIKINLNQLNISVTIKEESDHWYKINV